MNGTTVFLAVFILYWLAVSALSKRGFFEKYNITAHGPILMIRTERGLKFIDKLASRKRFWKLFANIGIVMMFVGMTVMFSIIILSDIILLTSLGTEQLPEPGKLHEPRNIFLIPGVNEFIPVVWGLIALIVTLIVHEFAHAILARVENIKVKSMGILVALVPIGGFAEPDEEELFGVSKNQESPGMNESKKLEPEEYRSSSSEKKVATCNQRARILSAGVMANFVVALIALTLFFGPVLGAIAPVSNAMVVNVDPGSPAFDSQIREEMVIVRLDDTPVQSASDVLRYLSTLEEGSQVTVHTKSSGEISTHNLLLKEPPEAEASGIRIMDVVQNSPASQAGLEEGMVIKELDGMFISSVDDFVDFMGNTSPGQTISMEVHDQNNEEVRTVQITLTSHHEDEDRGFLGIVGGPVGDISTSLGFSVGDMSVGYFPADVYLEMLKQIPSMMSQLGGWIIILGFPIIGFAGEGFPGFGSTLAQAYEPIGWAEPMGMGIFWIANTLLWIGWLNFYVGLFNCLPAIPLDGGHVFRDYAKALVMRITGNEIKATRIASATTVFLSLLILISIVFMIFGPYLVHGF